MKHDFKCVDCGKLFEIEADVFEPGVSGNVYTSNGEHIRYVDPTTEHSCTQCVSRWYDEFLTQLSEFERGELE